MNVLTVDYRNDLAPRIFTRSLLDTGFAVLTNHPIPHELIFQTYAEWEKYFSSDSKKNDLFDPKTQAGYFPFRSENAKDSQVKDLKEFFHMYAPKDLPSFFSDSTWELRNRLVSLGEILLGWVEDNTPQDIRQNFSMPLRKMIEGSQQTLLRILHYPPLPEGIEDNAIRAAAHEDINLITLLPSASAPGLQVKDTQGRWHDVPCDPGSIVINAADMLQEASGGYYRSTTHQVVNPSGEQAKKSRYSLPLFLHPRPEVRLSHRHTADSSLHERLKELGLK